MWINGQIRVYLLLHYRLDNVGHENRPTLSKLHLAPPIAHLVNFVKIIAGLILYNRQRGLALSVTLVACNLVFPD